VNSQRAEINVGLLSLDDGKIGWLARREITPEHVLEVFYNRATPPHYFVRTNPENGKQEYSMVGRIDTGRYLIVPIEQVEGAHWRVISGNWLESKRGERRYRRE
jgi:hypothetical protein